MKTKLFFLTFLTSLALIANSQDWTRIKTVNDPLGPGSGFGTAITIKGDFASISDMKSKSVYLYKYENGSWNQKDSKQVLSASASFGYCIAINDNQVFVGDNGQDINSQPSVGKVYVFDYDPSTGLMSNMTSIIHSDWNMIDLFGSSLAVYNNYLFVGAMNKENQNNINTGALYIFKKDNIGNWVQNLKIAPNNGSNGDMFGSYISVSHDSIAISSIKYDQPNISDAGTVYVYKFDISNNSVSLINQLFSSTPVSNEYFGRSLKFRNGEIITGAPHTPGNGSVYCFRVEQGQFVFKQKLIGDHYTSILNCFGLSLDFNNNNLFIGNYTESPENGSVYVYSRVNRVSDWQFKKKETNQCYSLYNSGFGASIAADENNILIGAVSSNVPFPIISKPLSTGSSNTSAVYFYKKNSYLQCDAGMDKIVGAGSQVMLGGFPTAWGGNPTYTYVWQTSSGIISNVANPLIISNSNETYYLTVTDQNNGCQVATDIVTVSIAECKYPVTLNSDFNNSIIERPGVNGDVVLLGYLNKPSLILSNGFILNMPDNCTYNNNDYLVKLNSSGDVLWAHIMHNECGYYTKFQPHNLFVDNIGNTYLVYNFFGELIFDNDFSISNSGLWNTVVMKFDQSGNIMWHTILPSPNEFLWFRDCAITSDGLYVSAIGNDYLLYKINLNQGNVLWTSIMGDQDRSICCDGSKVYVDSPSELKQINSLSGSIESLIPKDIINDPWVVVYGGNNFFFEIKCNQGALPSIISYKMIESNNAKRLVFNKEIPYQPYIGGLAFSGLDNVVFSSNRINEILCIQKNDMDISHPQTLLWSNDLGGFDQVCLAANHNLNYGYVLAHNTIDGSCVLNKFSLNDGQIGCSVGKAPKSSINTEDDQKLYTFNAINYFNAFKPNPTTGKIRFAVPTADQDKELKIELVNCFGHIVRNYEMVGNTEIEIDLTDFSNGIYLIQVYSAGKIIVKEKIVKQ